MVRRENMLLVIRLGYGILILFFFCPFHFRLLSWIYAIQLKAYNKNIFQTLAIVVGLLLLTITSAIFLFELEKLYIHFCLTNSDRWWWFTAEEKPPKPKIISISSAFYYIFFSLLTIYCLQFHSMMMIAQRKKLKWRDKNQFLFIENEYELRRR